MSRYLEGGDEVIDNPPPAHRQPTTSPPTHQPTNPPTHQPTNSPPHQPTHHQQPNNPTTHQQPTTNNPPPTHHPTALPSQVLNNVVKPDPRFRRNFDVDEEAVKVMFSEYDTDSSGSIRLVGLWRLEDGGWRLEVGGLEVGGLEVGRLEVWRLKVGG